MVRTAWTEGSLSRLVKFGLASVLCALAASGLDQTGRGLATNRAWVGVCILGAAIVCISPVAFVAALASGRGYKNAFLSMLWYVLIGLSPIATVLLLTGPRLHWHWSL
jgi:hypothetical protein